MKKIFYIILIFTCSFSYGQLALSFLPNSTSCYGSCDGNVTIICNGGVGPYTCTLSPSGLVKTFGAVTTFSSLCSGYYQVNAIDQNGLTGTQQFYIPYPPKIHIAITSKNISCPNVCDGRASATPETGVNPFNFAWSTGESDINVQNLCPGVYSIQITDGNGCSSVESFTINTSLLGNLTGVTPNLQITNETCFNTQDGGINLIVSGTNTGPFTYLWNNNATTQNIANLSAGVYSVTIFDNSNNCLNISDSLKIDSVNCGKITGNVFVDNNNDCIFNSGDSYFHNSLAYINPGNRYAYINTNGYYAFNNLAYNTYTIALVNNNKSVPACATSIITTVNGTNSISNNNDFLVDFNSSVLPDMYITANSTSFIPGFAGQIIYYLGSLNNVTNIGKFKVLLPQPLLSNILSISPATYTISSDTIIWNYSNIIYGGYNIFILNFNVPVNTPLGSLFTNCAYAQDNNSDFNLSNNTFCHQRVVTGSFDPNDKTVSPAGLGITGDIIDTETDLNYLIRFQNTGNGPAVNIVVKDTLSPNVDVTTFEMQRSSHNCSIDILPGNVLRWKFNSIMLPDSNNNEPGSHGYIQYRVKRTNNNAPGTQIKNTAYIYFDFNEPVMTNTALNTIAIFDGIGYQNKSNDQWQIYPNPSTGIINLINNYISSEDKVHILIVNAFGQLVYEEITNANHKIIDLTKLCNGVYFVKLVSDKQSSVKRIVLSH